MLVILLHVAEPTSGRVELFDFSDLTLCCMRLFISPHLFLHAALKFEPSIKSVGAYCRTKSHFQRGGNVLLALHPLFSSRILLLGNAGQVLRPLKWIKRPVRLVTAFHVWGGGILLFEDQHAPKPHRAQSVYMDQQDCQQGFSRCMFVFSSWRIPNETLAYKISGVYRCGTSV